MKINLALNDGKHYVSLNQRRLLRMTDTTLCINEQCTKKGSCSRMLMVPGYYQSYAKFLQNPDGSCDSYIYEPGSDDEIKNEPI